MDRKSYLTNYSTDLLFTVIGENEKELLLLQIKLLDTKIGYYLNVSIK